MTMIEMTKDKFPIHKKPIRANKRTIITDGIVVILLFNEDGK